MSLGAAGTISFSGQNRESILKKNVGYDMMNCPGGFLPRKAGARGSLRGFV
jgi:hypothetical protein